MKNLKRLMLCSFGLVFLIESPLIVEGSTPQGYLPKRSFVFLHKKNLTGTGPRHDVSPKIVCFSSKYSHGAFLFLFRLQLHHPVQFQERKPKDQ